MIREDSLPCLKKLPFDNIIFLWIILPYSSIFNINFNNILQNHAESSQAVYPF